MSEDITLSMSVAFEAGQEHERAAIVAWLRAYAEGCSFHSVVPSFLKGAANKIERGQHLEATHD